MKSYLIKVYHSFQKGKTSFENFLNDISNPLSQKRMFYGIHYTSGEFFFSFHAKDSTYSAFESQFYTQFNDFQVVPDTKKTRDFDPKKSVVGELQLVNKSFFPFMLDDDDDTDFIFNIFRSFESFDVINDKLALYVEVEPIVTESFGFFVSSKFKRWLFKFQLLGQFYKYLFNSKIKKNRKVEGEKYYKDKLQWNLFNVRIFMVTQSANKDSAEGRLRAVYNNFKWFKNYPYNQFALKIHKKFPSLKDIKNGKWGLQKYFMTAKEVAQFFHFPQNPKKETSLLTVKSRKLALPIGVPTYNYSHNKKNEVMAGETPRNTTVVWVTDYRSITVPIGLYDEDRLRHVYIVWQTWVGKSKFMQSLMISDIKKGKWIGVVDPHGDLIEEIIQHIPEDRLKDVVMFDPTDEQFPFCFNPLDVKETESKQILAKWFIDIFHKFFGANRNPKLEHVLRMIFLALLDKPNSTLFDIIRALTDKDFRYDMIDAINDDVVRNFWTNEFAGWSQQFNTEAIMPILNKVGQLLSIDILKNIFASPENRLDFREVMDTEKILLVKLPKGKLQEDIMWFLGAMFITKIYQSAMGRQWLSKKERTPFFLYVDEFQNFATQTFNEILSEARKYGLWLTVAHQFIRQIPQEISNALFGNVGTKVSFRISSDDAGYMKQHFAPFLEDYDLANLNMREFYCKTMIQWQVKDPFSLRSTYTPDADIDREYIAKLRDISRERYCRTLEEAKQVVQTEQKEVLEKIEDFAEPLI